MKVKSLLVCSNRTADQFAPDHSLLHLQTCLHSVLFPAALHETVLKMKKGHY